MRLCFSFVLAALLACAGSPPQALAQARPDSPAAGYRTGGPAVINPPPSPDPDAASDETTRAFKRWYASARSPAIVIFWNRALSDETTTRLSDETSAHEEDRTSEWAAGDANSGEYGGETVTTKDTAEAHTRRPLTGGDFAALDAGTSARLQTAFQAAWLDAGVEVVDRNAIIRKMSTRSSTADRGDLQYLEAAALEQGGEYLVEVLPTSGEAASSGLTFQVKVIHLPTSTVKVQFLSTARPPAGQARWVATAQGFRQQVDERATPETMGAELALETMARLAR